MDDDNMLDSYRAFLQTRCSYYVPGNEDFLSGEIVFQFHNRKSLVREMSGQQAELARIDGVLSGLLFEQKKRLCRQGRNGRWSAWLKQHRIQRATADRLVLEHVEFFGLQHELSKRERFELPAWKISRAAYQVSDRHEQMLMAPESKITFLTCLADRLGVAVDYEKGGSVRLFTPSPEKPEDIDYRVPNVIQVDASGKLVPVNYELADDDGEGNSTPPPSSDEVL